MTQRDQALIRGYLTGATAAVRVIDRWIAAAVQSFRFRLGHRWEDLLQDIRLETVRLFQAGDFRGEAQLKTYVWRTAVHAAINQVRRESLRDHRSLDEVPAPLEAAASPLEQAIRAQEEGIAHRVLEEAGVPCQQLWRRILDGCSYAEMSTEFGVSPGALRARVWRCRQCALQSRDRLLRASKDPSGRKDTF